MQASSIGVRSQGAHVNLQSVAQFEADLVVAFGEDLIDSGEQNDLLDEGRALRVVDAAGASDQKIEVADGLSTATQGTGGSDCVNSFDAFQVGGKLFGGAVGFVDQETSRDAAIVFDGLENLLLGFALMRGRVCNLFSFASCSTPARSLT